MSEKKSSGSQTQITTVKKESAASNVKIQQLFKLMVDNNASDLHITSGSSPCMRVNGDIVRVKIPTLTPDDTKRLVYQVLTEDQKNQFEKEYYQ